MFYAPQYFLPFSLPIFSGRPLTNSAFPMHSNIISTNLESMGSFRSQPDKEKHTQVQNCTNFSYAVSHMCGKDADIQGGESTWRMRISPSQN